LYKEFRAKLGRNMSRITTGGAQTPIEVLNWMSECFADCFVREGYGLTEIGTGFTYLKYYSDL